MWVEWSFQALCMHEALIQLLQGELRMTGLHSQWPRGLYFNTLRFPSLDQGNSRPWPASFGVEFLTVLSPLHCITTSSQHPTAKLQNLENKFLHENPLPQTLSHQRSLTTASCVASTDILAVHSPLRQQHAALLCFPGVDARSFLKSFQEPWVRQRAPWHVWFTSHYSDAQLGGVGEGSVSPWNWAWVLLGWFRYLDLVLYSGVVSHSLRKRLLLYYYPSSVHTQPRHVTVQSATPMQSPWICVFTAWFPATRNDAWYPIETQKILLEWVENTIGGRPTQILSQASVSLYVKC